MFDYIYQILSEGNLWFVGAAVFAASFIEYFFPPFPSDLIVLLGAFTTGIKEGPGIVIWCVATSGSWLGSMALFYSSSKGRRRYIVDKTDETSLAKGLSYIEDLFKKHGVMIIAINRFVPGIRPFFLIAAGISDLSPMKVGLFSFLSIAGWNTLIITLGLLGGSNFDAMILLFRKYTFIASAIAAACFLLIILIFTVRHRRKSE